MATPKQGTDLINAFIKRQEDRYATADKINRHSAKWAARDLIDSYGLRECVAAIDWACRVNDKPFTWNWYTTNVGRLLQAKDQAERDREARQERRRQAREWLNS